jgi:uncharacterized protein YfeS
MKSYCIVSIVFIVISCGQVQEKSKHEQIVSNKPIESMSDYSPSFEKAHPKAKELMTDEFYFDPLEETAPFGNDDGADTYAGFKDWRTSHATDNPADFLFDQINEWGYPKFDIYETDITELRPYLKESELSSRYMSGIDAAIIAIAFGQLYLEGTIHKEFKETAEIAVNRQLLPELLSLWGDAYKFKREEQLKKMAEVLNKVN